MITTEQVTVGKHNGYIGLVKDRDKTNVNTKCYNIGSLNMQSAVQALPPNEEQIETDRILI